MATPASILLSRWLSPFRFRGLRMRDKYHLLPVLLLMALACVHEVLCMIIEFQQYGALPPNAMGTYAICVFALCLCLGYGGFLFMPVLPGRLRTLVYMLFPVGILAVCAAMVLFHHPSLIWFGLPGALIIGQLYQMQTHGKWFIAMSLGMVMAFGVLWMDHGTAQMTTLMVKDHPLIEASHGALLSLGFAYLLSCVKRYDDCLKEVADALNDARASSERDGLTGLYNRRSLDAFLTRELARSRRSKQPLSIALFDIDFFKKINDVYGHQAGDDVLRQLSGLIQDNLRQSDILARYGGEEFTILLPETRCIEGLTLLERLREKVEAHLFLAGGKPLKVTISLGITQFDVARHESPAALLDEGDKALYEAKENGRNRVCAYGLGELSQKVAQERSRREQGLPSMSKALQVESADELPTELPQNTQGQAAPDVLNDTSAIGITVPHKPTPTSSATSQSAEISH
jgi:diguanylate cyclase (GGDEF)-like protein